MVATIKHKVVVKGNVLDSQKQGVPFIASILMTDAHNSYGLGNRVCLSAKNCCF